MSSEAARLAPADPVAARSEGGGVCILSRKDLRNITRVPRMAKALSDAGFRVVVVSLRAPVAELREMSRGADYVEVGPRPFTARLVSILNFRVFARNRRLQAEAEALARGGWRALAVRSWRLLTAPLAGDARLLRRYLLAAPAAAL